MTNCDCFNEETEACAYNEHNKCDETTIRHMCMCFCHYQHVGDRFVTHGYSWIKTGPKTVERIQ